MKYNFDLEKSYEIYSTEINLKENCLTFLSQT